MQGKALPDKQTYAAHQNDQMDRNNVPAVLVDKQYAVPNRL